MEKYSYTYLRDEAYQGLDCFVVERRPAYKYSGYTSQVAWYDKAHYRPQKVIYYDRKNSLLKTLILKNHKQYLGKYWRADEMFMENHQTGKTTRLDWRNYRFGKGFTDRDFDKSTLKRLR